MTGILETLAANVALNTAALNNLAAAVAAGGGIGGAQTAVTAATLGLGATTAPVAPTFSPAAQAATDASTLALIQPHLGNDPVKAAFGDAMRALGVANLPEATPADFPKLYDAFEKIIARMVQTTAATSII